METETKLFGEPEHIAFVGGEDFDGSLFDDVKLLTIAIVPSSFPKELVDFQKEEITEWLEKTPFGNNLYRPFLNGVRFMEFCDPKEETKTYFITSLFRNATISYCGKIPHNDSENKVISLRSIFSEIVCLITYAGKFYGKIGFDEPVKIYFQLTRIKGLSIDVKEFEEFEIIRRPIARYSKETEGKWHYDNLEFIEESSGKEIKEENAKVSKRISERLAHAFGIRNI